MIRKRQNPGKAPEGDVPQQLRQHVEEGDEEISNAEVHDHEVHAAQLLAAQRQHEQHHRVADHGQGEDQPAGTTEGKT